MEKQYQEFKLSFGEPLYGIGSSESGKMRVICKVGASIIVPQFPNVGFNINRDIVGIGVATCSDDDTPDVEIGKKVARAKAESSAYIQACKRIDNGLGKYEQIYGKFFDKASRVTYHNDRYIETISNCSTIDPYILKLAKDMCSLDDPNVSREIVKQSLYNKYHIDLDDFIKLMSDYYTLTSAELD